MARTDKITIDIAGHGTYQTEAEALDMMIDCYLPASVASLRDKIRTRQGLSSSDPQYRDLDSVTACLMILANLDGHATN